MNRTSFGSSLAGALALAVFASGCGGGGSSGGGGTPAASGTQVGGSVVANVVANATIRVFSVDASGNLTQVGLSSSDAAGNFSFEATGSPPYLIVATGGSYIDEATGAARVLGSAVPSTLGTARPGTLECLVGTGSSPTQVTLTPVSSLVARRVLDQLSRDSNALSSSNVGTVNRAVAEALGLGSIDPRTISPFDFTSADDAAAIAADPSGNRARLGLLLAAFSQAGQTRNLSDPLELVEALALDFEDGTFDGQQGSGQTLRVGNTDLGTAASQGLRQGAEGFLATGRNLSGTSVSNHSGLLDTLSAPSSSGSGSGSGSGTGAGTAGGPVIPGLTIPSANTVPNEFFVNDDPATGSLRAHTTAEQALADEVLRLTNVFRADNGLPPFQALPVAFQSAKSHAEDMARRNYFNHSTADFNGTGTGFGAFVRMGLLGVTGASGENIAAGNSTAQATVEQWKNSAGHRAAMLSTTHTHLGVGYAFSASSQFRHYWVQNFVRR